MNATTLNGTKLEIVGVHTIGGVVTLYDAVKKGSHGIMQVLPQDIIVISENQDEGMTKDDAAMMYEAVKLSDGYKAERAKVEAAEAETKDE